MLARILLLCLFLAPVITVAQSWKEGRVQGSVKDQSTGSALPSVNVVLMHTTDSSIVTGAVTDENGKFSVTGIPAGTYVVEFRMIGYAEKRTHAFTIDEHHKELDIGVNRLSQVSLNQDEVVVSAQKYLMTTTVDRKIYNVDQDVVNKTGSVSQVLENVPSVQVDMDGNVSLRGSSNVTILIDGKPSPLLDKNSADVLQSMPANSVDKIEVITNPSAKYQPDGTAGIINIVMKKDVDMGINGSATGNYGLEGRRNANLHLNYNPGRYNIFGSYSIRQDDRNRDNSDQRTIIDSTTGAVSYYHQDTYTHLHPLSNFGLLGTDVHMTDADMAGASAHLWYNQFARTDSATTVLRDSVENPYNIYARNRLDHEYQKEYGFTTYYEHDFDGKDHKLRFDFSNSNSPEQENNNYTNPYYLPQSATSFDNTIIGQIDNDNKASLEFSQTFDDKSKFEAGYAGDFEHDDFNFFATTFDTTQLVFVEDPIETNHFIFNQAIHAEYLTYERSFGGLGMLAGLRVEESLVSEKLLTLDSNSSYSLFNLYPTMHLSYQLTPGTDLQLNYSRRTNRPGGEDLNPFPEYRDPRNPTSGNPALKPEYVDAVELGVQLQNDLFSFIPSLFYRYTTNKFTTITIPLNDSTLLMTRENLASDQATGLELIGSLNLGETFSTHASVNAFYDQIDAANLGYSSNSSTITWFGNWTISVHATKTLSLQTNANFNSKRLTPQGVNQPSYYFNAGARQDFMDGRLSLNATLSDIFGTLRRELDLNTQYLDQTVVNWRDKQVFFLGLTYRFSSPGDTEKEDSWKYDDSGG
jgi:outer membrane receptor protein involved in Fe transport